MLPPPIPHPWVDSSRAPLYAFRLPGDMTLVALEAFGRAREEWARSVRGPVAFVADLRDLGVSTVSARHRKVFAEHLERFAAFEREHTAGVGIVADSTFARGVVTAVFWLRRPSFAYRVFDRVEDALRWAAGTIEARVTALSP